MKPRVCITCGSTTSYIDKRTDNEQWYKGQTCDVCYHRIRYKTNESLRIKHKKRSNEWYYNNREYAKEQYDKFRGKAFDILGRVCTCCGEINEYYLEADHIIAQKGTKIPSNTVYRDVIKLGSKALDKYQTLCARCNLNKKCNEKCTIDHTKDKYITIHKSMMFNTPSSLVYTV